MEKEPGRNDSVQNETKAAKVADNPKAAGGVAKTRKVNESKLRNDKVKYKQIQDIMLKGQAANEAEALAVWKKGRSKRLWTHLFSTTNRSEIRCLSDSSIFRRCFPPRHSGRLSEIRCF